MIKVLTTFVKRHGTIIASCAFAFVVLGTNTPCGWPFYEPKEPAGLEQFKKYKD